MKRVLAPTAPRSTSAVRGAPVRGLKALALAAAVACGGAALGLLPAAPALAHGAPAKMVPMVKTLEDFGATVRWDAFAKVYAIQRNSTMVRVKPGSRDAQVNGKPVTLDAPVQLVGKAVEAAARRVAGQRRDAARSWAAARGVWAFLRHELVRFWRT